MYAPLQSGRFAALDFLSRIASGSCSGAGVCICTDSLAYSSVSKVTILAGDSVSKGSADGLGPAARFARPMGLAVSAGGVAYVVDEESNHSPGHAAG